MVKHIHVPIPNQRAESASLHVVEEGAVRTALTTVTYARAFHHKTTFGPAGAPRGVNVVACLSYSAMANMIRETWGESGGRPPFDDVIVQEDHRQPIGINTLHITIGQAPDP
jgi:hypothetical protein